VWPMAWEVNVPCLVMSHTCVVVFDATVDACVVWNKYNKYNQRNCLGTSLGQAHKE